MPELIENPKDVEAWVQAKQRNEVEICKKIMEVFDTCGDLIDPLRVAAEKALEDMALVAENSEKGKKAVNDAIHSEKDASVKVLKEVAGIDDSLPSNVDVLRPIMARADKLSATQCSNVIRLYGDFIEKAGKQLAGEISPKLQEAYAALDAQKGGERKGVGPGANKSGPTDNPEHIWNTAKKKDERGNLVDMIDPRTKKPYATGRHRDVKSEAYKQLLELNPKSIEAHLQSLDGGSKRWELKDGSIISRMDQVFGLVPASDISGTTTDTIFFIQRFLGGNVMGKFDHVFYLLPVGTIVSGAHHSVVEVAAPLSQSKIMNYRIGYYDTLMPIKRTTHNGVKQLDAVLKNGFKDQRNRHMMIFYKAPHQIEGCYLFKGIEKSWLKFCDSVTALAVFQKIPAWPTKKDVYKVIMERKLV